MNGSLEYDWDGYDEVTIIFPELLRANTTYSVSLSRDLKNRRGNSLNESFHLIFSTGPQIDTAVLSGFIVPPIELPGVHVNAPPLRDIFILAYDITERTADTLDFTRTPADYITQPDERGAFRFLALKHMHTYRVFALQDVFRNRVYDLGVDAFGMPTSDVRLDSMVTTDFRIRMSSARDTLRPELQDAEATDRQHILLRFSEVLDSTSLRPENFVLTSDGPALSVVGVFVPRPDKRPSQVSLLLDGAMMTGRTYTVRVVGDSVRDITGNLLVDTSRSATFTTSQDLRAPDTLRYPIFSLQDSIRDISPMPEILITFSDAVDRERVTQGIALRDTGGAALATTVRWLDDARVIVSPVDTLASRVFYSLAVNTAFVRSPSPAIAALRDTTFLRRFQTTDVRENGRMTGTITMEDSLWARSPLRRLAVEILGTEERDRQIQLLPERTLTYAFDRVPRGRYRVRAYLVRDETLRFYGGSVVPYVFAMPSGDFPGEVDVRPRWSVDRVDFLVK